MVWDEGKLKQRIKLCEEQVAVCEARIKVASKECQFWRGNLKMAKDELLGLKQPDLFLG